MSWFNILLIVAVLAGVTAGTVLVVRSPNFWGGLIVGIVEAIMPYITRRMTPEEEAQFREAERAGRGEEWLRKRRGGPQKG